MRRLITAGVLALAAGGQAFAADLPQPGPPPQAPAAYIPAPPPVYNWGGVYFGINGGYGFGKTKWTDPNNSSGLGSTGTFDVTGFQVGPTIGANFQVDAFVFGVEGDVDASWLDGKSSSAFCGNGKPAPGGALGFGVSAQCETKNTWLGTVRGRLGYAVDRVLFYGTGGGAFGNIQAGANGGLVSSTKFGWTAGTGVEAAFTDNWTGRIEYLYVNLQNATCNTANPCGNDPGPVPANQTVKLSTSMIRLGVDYKFR
jgi:outer membrane immunogenic protein